MIGIIIVFIRGNYEFKSQNLKTLINMKTKTVAISFALTLAGYALFAQTDTIPKKDTIPSDSIPPMEIVNNDANLNLTTFYFSEVGARDTIPMPTDSIPKKDTLNNEMNSNFTAFNFQGITSKDTIPTDSLPKKDTLNNEGSLNLVAFNFHGIALRDTIPTDSVPKKDTLNNDVNLNLVAFNFSGLSYRDTVPTPGDTIPKKDSLALNSNSTFPSSFGKLKNSKNYSIVNVSNSMKNENIVTIPVYKTA